MPRSNSNVWSFSSSRTEKKTKNIWDLICAKICYTQSVIINWGSVWGKNILYRKTQAVSNCCNTCSATTLLLYICLWLASWMGFVHVILEQSIFIHCDKIPLVCRVFRTHELKLNVGKTHSVHTTLTSTAEQFSRKNWCSFSELPCFHLLFARDQ